MSAHSLPSVSSEKSTIDRSLEGLMARRTTAMAFAGVCVRGVNAIHSGWGERFAARMFLTPRRAKGPAREAEWLRGAQPEVFAAGRFKLRGHRWSASGEPVLLVHGWEGRGSQMGSLARLIATLGFQPITIDLPAHGASPGRQTNLIELAEAVRAMVLHIGGVSGIVAHSFGAAATTVALRSPLPVGRLAYIAPTENFAYFPALFGGWLGLSPDLTTRMQRSIERRLGATMAELRGRAIAPTLTHPLLIVHDTDDADVPFEDGAAYAKSWPSAQLVTTGGLGHRRILRDAQTLEAVRQFFKEPSN